MMIRKTVVIFVLSIVSLYVNDVLSQKPSYCVAPLPNPSEETDGYTLEMVQVITRHGDRTPLYSTLESNTEAWDCNLGWFMTSSFNNMKGPEYEIDRLFRKVYMQNREYLPGNCSEGQLTSVGYSQHLALGEAFKELYVEKYQFLPNELTDSDTIWVRSTDVSRTIQSAQAHLTGLFPPSTITPGSGIPIININTMDDFHENMEPNTVLCPELQVQIDNTTTTAEWSEFIANSTSLKQDIMQTLGISEFPGWDALLDLFFALQCHDFELPPGVTQEMVNGVYDYAFLPWKYQVSFPMVARLGMSTFLEEIVDNIKSYITGNSTTSYFLFSGHDDTIGSFNNIFGIMKEWPPYASHIELELWSNESKEYFIQYKTNGESYTLENCGSVMCPIDNFIQLANTIIVPDYSVACSNSTGSTYF